MTIDDRLNQHLERQAAAITLTPADAGEAMTRGRRRRTHRRVALTAVVAVAAVGVAALAVSPSGNDAEVQGALTPAVAPSSFDWTVVDPHTGLGYAGAATLAAGSLYNLSTAPGATNASSGNQHLYRSDDGTDWSEVSLPPGISTSSLAGSGDGLYALGTAPAPGGGRDLVLAASTDGAQSWTNVALPSEIHDLDQRFPDEVEITQPIVAAQDADHIVAAIQVVARPYVANQLPGFNPETQRTEATAAGVDVYWICDDDCIAVDPASSGADLDDAKRAAEKASKEVVAHYDWDELDVDPALLDLVGGRTYVYSTQDGSHFEASELPDDVTGDSIQAVATDAGFRLFVNGWPDDKSAATTHVLSSVDGTRFTEATAALAGGIGGTGVLDGRAAVSVWHTDGSYDVFVEQGGTWARLALTQAAGVPATLGEVAFGPLGLVAVLWETQGEKATPLIVHSVDGTTVSTVPLAAAGLDTEDLRNIQGLSVTADGVFVRLGSVPDGDPATVPTQRVLVGTPA